MKEKMKAFKEVLGIYQEREFEEYEQMYLNELCHPAFDRFLSNIYSAFYQLERHVSHNATKRNLPELFAWVEYLSLKRYLEDYVNPAIKKINRFLKSNGYEEISYSCKDLVEEGQDPCFFLMDYYHLALHIRDNLYLDLITAAPSEIEKQVSKMGKFYLYKLDVKRDILAHYYVMDLKEKEKMDYFFQYAKKDFQGKLSSMFWRYVQRVQDKSNFTFKVEGYKLTFVYDEKEGYQELLNDIKEKKKNFPPQELLDECYDYLIKDIDFLPHQSF